MTYLDINDSDLERYNIVIIATLFKHALFYFNIVSASIGFLYYLFLYFFRAS